MGIVNKLVQWFSGKDREGNEFRTASVLEEEPKTLEDIQKLFQAFGIGKYFEAVKPLVRNAIKLDLTPQDEPVFPLLQSKIGGRPTLGENQEWPVNKDGIPMSFIGQLNMAEINAFDPERRFPEKGLLSFFYCSNQETWGFDPADKDSFKVIYTENATGMEIRDFPEEINTEGVFLPNRIDFEAVLSIPGSGDYTVGTLMESDDFEKYSDISRGLDNQVFGYANAIQGEMELECQLVTNGLYCGDESGYEDPKREALESGMEDWILLLQIDSEEEKTGMMWGDCGRIYFWIKKQDLANRDFDKTWCMVQCY